MAERVPQGDPEPAEAPGPQVVITFAGRSSSEMIVRAAGVTLSQLMGAAFYLDCLAREARAGQVSQAAVQELTPEAIAALLRGGDPRAARG